MLVVIFFLFIGGKMFLLSIVLKKGLFIVKYNIYEV